MAGSENAKKSGDLGEKIVSGLLDMFGWSPRVPNLKIDCHFNDKHARKGKESSTTHGIDVVYKYSSPLKDDVQQNVFVSVKCRDHYPAKDATIIQNFKEFLVDLANAIECYPFSDNAKQKLRGMKHESNIGVIFWIDRTPDSVDKDIISIVQKFRNTEPCTYDVISLIDNCQASFLYNAIKFVKTKYHENEIKFRYIDTGYNNKSPFKSFSGSILPVEYINSYILPFQVTKSDGNELIILMCKEDFDRNNFRRMVGLTQELTKDLASQIDIYYPNYDSYSHDSIVNEVKTEFADEKLISKIKVGTYSNDFREVQE